MSKVGNNSGKDYILCCCICSSTRKDIHMVGHRNKDNHLIGFLYVCDEHTKQVEGKNFQVKFVDEKEETK